MTNVHFFFLFLLKSMCAAFDLQLNYWMDFWNLVSLFERSVFRSDSLKQKVTVGKDTLNIKRAVCCSEVGDIEKTVRGGTSP